MRRIGRMRRFKGVESAEPGYLSVLRLLLSSHYGSPWTFLKLYWKCWICRLCSARLPNAAKDGIVGALENIRTPTQQRVGTVWVRRPAGGWGGEWGDGKSKTNNAIKPARGAGKNLCFVSQKFGRNTSNMLIYWAGLYHLCLNPFLFCQNNL